MHNNNTIAAAAQDQATLDASCDRCDGRGYTEGESPDGPVRAICPDCQPLDFTDDEPYIPSPEDERWYLECCREREARLWEERIARDEERDARELRRDEADARLAAAVYAAAKAGTFREMLADLANAFRDHTGDDLAWVGGKMADLYDLAVSLEATGGDQFDDRFAAMVDCREAAHAAR